MTQASTLIITKKNALTDKGVKAVTDKLSKVPTTDLVLEKAPKKTGEKEFFAQGKTEDRIKKSTKDLSIAIRTIITGDIKDADLKE